MAAKENGHTESAGEIDVLSMKRSLKNILKPDPHLSRWTIVACAGAMVLALTVVQFRFIERKVHY